MVVFEWDWATGYAYTICSWKCDQNINSRMSIHMTNFTISRSLKGSRGPSWPWSYASCIYNYLDKQCLSPLMWWVRISIRARCTTLSDKICQWPTTGWWFSPGPPVSSTTQTDRHDITEIMLKVALNTIKHTNKLKRNSILAKTFHDIQNSLELNF